MMAIKAVLFDVGGVLLTLGEAEYRRELVRRLGLSDIPTRYDQVTSRLQKGELLETDFWQSLAGRPVASNAFDDLWLAYYRHIPEMQAVAAEVRALGVRTAIFSNTTFTHARLMKGMGLFADFDPVILSFEVGSCKPEPEMYLHALRLLDLSPAEVAYIDDVPEYVAAADKLGIRAIQHTGNIYETRRALFGLLQPDAC
jgi:HAD superfamily hydrolase (TIGR01509 family)